MNNKNCTNIRALISKSLNTPYNWSIWLMTFVIWIFSGNLISYNNGSNFDMLLALHSYIQWLSLGVVIVGLIKADEKYLRLAKYGILTYLLSILTIIFSKTLFITAYLAIFILKPASIFFFLMIIKQIWELTSDSIVDNSASDNIAVTAVLENQINLKDESMKLVEAQKPKKLAAAKRKSPTNVKSKKIK
jgi:hypothetical protein